MPFSDKSKLLPKIKDHRRKKPMIEELEVLQGEDEEAAFTTRRGKIVNEDAILTGRGETHHRLKLPPILKQKPSSEDDES